MGRAALGSAAKTVVGATRITTTEQQKLIAKYGSVSNFLRRKVDEEMQEELDK